jgi:glycosyltransferase involved in cell wall biosynthesis
MFFKRGFLFYKFFNIRLFFYLLFNKYDLLVANDLDTLLPNFLVSKLKKLPLVYDSHEYFTGVPELNNRQFVKGVWTLMEKMIFPFLKNVITVSEPIASMYEGLYHVKPLVVRNLSKNADNIIPFTKVETGIDLNSCVIIMQGTGINIDKGAEELIDAVKISEGVTLFIVGSGDVIVNLKAKVSNIGITDKVRFVPNVSWENLIRYTKSADIGMCLEKDTNLNYRYSLPNKLFDYISAGIPVICSNLPETRKIIDEYDCGIVIDNVTPEYISIAIKELATNPAKLTELKRNAIHASSILNWENESKKVIDLYNKILICNN